MTAIVTRGNAADLHLPDETVDLVVTSPPYWSLRSYQDDGQHYTGQIDDERTPSAYLHALARCTQEWMRVLKPGGSIFVNLGDKYGPDKSLMFLPQRYASRCIDDLDLILRAEIVWAKPNGLPESVTDRVRRSHEQVFHFVKQPRYYSAVDEVREQSATIVTESGSVRYRKPGEVQEPRARSYTAASKVNAARGDSGMVGASGNPLGKLPGSVWEIEDAGSTLARSVLSAVSNGALSIDEAERILTWSTPESSGASTAPDSVWTIPTSPLKVPDHLGIDHFAAYPPELVRRIVLGWSPREVCTACGEGRRPVSTTELTKDRGGRKANIRVTGLHTDDTTSLGRERFVTVTGYACACPDTAAPATPGVVLDPFGGTGTTALVASAFGRVGISVDLSADYCRLARWRTTDPGERARVLGVDKPPVQIQGQLGLFEGGAA